MTFSMFFEIMSIGVLIPIISVISEDTNSESTIALYMKHIFNTSDKYVLMTYVMSIFIFIYGLKLINPNFKFSVALLTSFYFYDARF